MIIIHRVEATEEEIDTIFNEIKGLMTQTYSTQAQQDEALRQGKLLITASIGKLVSKAFAIGKNIGEARADEKDMTMY